MVFILSLFGDSNYWEAMMGATSITDLLNRVEYVSEVYDYDRSCRMN